MPPISLPSTGMHNPLDGPFLVAQQPGVPSAVPPGVPVRRLTLNEDIDGYGRLLQTLGTDQPVSNTGRARLGLRPAVRRCAHRGRQPGSIEVWEIFNLSADTHPIHFHLVNVQVLSRQAFNRHMYAGRRPALERAAVGTGRRTNWAGRRRCG